MAGVPAAGPVQQIDVNEAGRVLATLDDWRALLFGSLVINGVLVLLVIALVGVIVWFASRRSANDQATLEVVKENTKAAADHSASIRAMETIVARIEVHLPEPIR